MSHPSAWFDVIPLWYGCHMETTTTPPVASRATTTPADILAMTTADLLTLGERCRPFVAARGRVVDDQVVQLRSRQHRPE